VCVPSPCRKTMGQNLSEMHTFARTRNLVKQNLIQLKTTDILYFIHHCMSVLICETFIFINPDSMPYGLVYDRHLDCLLKSRRLWLITAKLLN
jgi:hypothetical protein